MPPLGQQPAKVDSGCAQGVNGSVFESRDVSIGVRAASSRWRGNRGSAVNQVSDLDPNIRLRRGLRSPQVDEGYATYCHDLLNCFLTYYAFGISPLAEGSTTLYV